MQQLLSIWRVNTNMGPVQIQIRKLWWVWLVYCQLTQHNMTAKPLSISTKGGLKSACQQLSVLCEWLTPHTPISPLQAVELVPNWPQARLQIFICLQSDDTLQTIKSTSMISVPQLKFHRCISNLPYKSKTSAVPVPHNNGWSCLSMQRYKKSY